MHVLRSAAAAAALVIVGAGTALAQRAPVALPIIGPPAAEQPAQPPAVPSEPPALPPAASAPPSAAQAPAGANRGARKLELTVSQGTLALDAQNVPLREILTEWERRSGCTFVNADKLPALSVTLQFPAGTPQTRVIDSLLRGLGTGGTGYGYIVAPRAGQTTASSPCGAVYILPSSRPTASASYAPPSPLAAPLVSPGFPDDEIPPVVPFPVAPPVRPRPMPGQLQPPDSVPGQPGQAPPGEGSPAPPPPGFGPVAPTAPGAGGMNQPPPQPAPQGGRGGNQD